MTAPEASTETAPSKEESDDVENGKTGDCAAESNSETGKSYDEMSFTSAEFSHYHHVVLSGTETKGKDFDLKKLRSELKMPADGSPSASKAGAAGAAASVPAPTQVPSSSSVPSASPPAQQDPATAGVVRTGGGGGDDDIYEFREPEPFEFEVRARRESPFNEDRVSHARFPQQQRKPGSKDDEEEPAPKKSAVCGVKSFFVATLFLKFCSVLAEGWICRAEQTRNVLTPSERSRFRGLSFHAGHCSRRTSEFDRSCRSVALLVSTATSSASCSIRNCCRLSTLKVRGLLVS